MQIAHNKGRLEQFSDGVFSIAITLLALELHVPTFFSTVLQSSVTEITPLIPNIITFIISFITIAIFWVNHHQLTQEIGPISRRILWSNMLVLLFITLIPFGTKAVSTNVLHPLAVMSYATILCGGSISFSLLRYFVHRSYGETNIPMRRSLVGPVIYLLAIALAPFSVFASYFWLAIPPLYYFLPKNHQTTITS